MTPSIAAASAHSGTSVRHDRASPPTGKTPYRLTRPHVGLIPVSPQVADGNLIEPPVSLPIEPKQSPAEVATPDPLDEEPTQ
jgi:hypothetical protein